MGTQLPKKGTAPNYRPMCVVAKRLDGPRFKTPTPLDGQVRLGPGDIVLHADSTPPKGGIAAPPPLFGPYVGQTAGWIKMPFGTEIGLLVQAILC